MAILAATGVAFLGTLLWVVLVSTTSMRFMILPWLIGAAVGYGSTRAGGRGFLMGGLCALLILVFGLLGRLACVSASPDSFYVPPAVSEDMRLVAQTYEELADTMSAAYGMSDSVPSFESDEDLRWYIVDNGLTEATAPEDVTLAELRQWRDALQANNAKGSNASHSELTAIIEELDAAHPDTPLEIYSATLGPWDFIWIFFGMAAAFFIGGAREGSL
ncbi:MAG: hypothetical protein PWP23_1255 [Candidatus Sumerlaeota bacterium]|nr:hypothetical protein [Candidatus Sumerlaeota bacterium]